MDKSILKEFAPPVVIRLLRKSGLFKFANHWQGDYESWTDALKNSEGYDSQQILEKVKQALLKVKNGEAVYERDSVLFDVPDYNWPVLTFMMLVLAKKKFLNVLDFGGSLGSTYFQNRKFFEGLDVKWNIVEQPHFVKSGKETFEDSMLKFHNSIEECLSSNPVNLLILSSVTPYLESPYTFLEQVATLNVDFVIFDKTPLIDASRDRLTVQHVPPSIYNASYPAWFFSESKFRAHLQQHYQVFAEFDNHINSNIDCAFTGFLLCKKKK
jgi:putative methyltransferase (TIGR04325 family)